MTELRVLFSRLSGLVRKETWNPIWMKSSIFICKWRSPKTSARE